MKLVAVLALVCCLAIGAWATPVPRSKVDNKVTSTNAVQVEQRQAAGQPAAAAADEDDDDDDDDDDVDLDITGDDDDDDEDDDDDDEEDYLERFIDDILGGDDDDDDEDEASSAVEPAAGGGAPAQSSAPTQSIPAAVQADLAAAVASAASDSDVAGEGLDAEADSGSYEDEAGDVVPEGQAAADVADSSVEAAEAVANAVPQSPAATASESSDEDDEDDDDDDDDDVDLDITGDDDDDDEDEDDEADEDDDEDEDDVDGIVEIADARRARALEPHTAGDVSAIYVAKYNRFVDNILGRINKILRANYDPVTVKLTNPNSNSKSNKKSKKTKRKKTKNGSGKSVSGEEKNVSDERANDMQNSVAQQARMNIIEATENDIKLATTMANSVSTAAVDMAETSTMQSGRRGSVASHTKKNKTRNKTKTDSKIKNTASNSVNNNNKTKQKNRKPRAKATLYGLASLQRAGDVSVNMMSDHTTIKTKFNLGPLTLKVEKEFGRAAKKELRSATATTAEMSGRLSLRVLHGGAATLHSIRVLQPRQVRVESADDHDRTREFVWKRSSHIAHLVSQKLSSATRSMLRPPPAQAA